MTNLPLIYYLSTFQADNKHTIQSQSIEHLLCQLTHRRLKDVFCYTYTYLLPYRIYRYLLDFSMVKSKIHIKKRQERAEKHDKNFSNLCAEKTEQATSPNILHLEEHPLMGNQICSQLIFLYIFFFLRFALMQIRFSLHRYCICQKSL